jgi:hypothetical protein
VHEWAEFAAQALDVPVEWREVERDELQVCQQQQEHVLAADLDF